MTRKLEIHQNGENDPSVQSVKGVVYMRKENFDARYVKERRGRDRVFRQVMSEEILRKEAGDLSNIEMEDTHAEAHEAYVASGRGTDLPTD